MSPLYDVPAHERAMVGLAMYGYLYCDGNLVKAILGRDWLMYLGAEQDDKRVGWDEEAKEAFLEFEQGAPGSQVGLTLWT